MRFNESPHMTSRDFSDISIARNNCDLVIVANFSEEELVIPKATVLGIAEEARTNRQD